MGGPDVMPGMKELMRMLKSHRSKTVGETSSPRPQRASDESHMPSAPIAKRVLRTMGAFAATAAMVGVACVAPAAAFAVEATSGAASESVAADAMPGNPSADLPDRVSAEIPDDATVLSERYAATPDGELKDIETGETVTDPKIVGTEDRQPDPLAKSDGESFIPVSAAEVKEQIAANGGDADADIPSSYSDDDDDNDDADAFPKARTSARSGALSGNEYGAYWGMYNGSPAFFDAKGDLFVQQAKGVIDVSTWQGSIDWQKVRDAGVDGAIIRLSYGWDNGFDQQALRNISECKRLGIPFGVYVFSYAESAADGASEGADVVKLLRQAGVNPGDLSYPVFYDLEQWTYTGHQSPTSPSVYEGIVDAWYAKLQAAGFNDLSVYSYTSYLGTALNSASIHGRTRWVAQYGATMQFAAFPTNDRGWQYSSSGQVSGISGSVDLNAFGNATYQAALDVRTMSSVSVPDGTYYLNAVSKDSSGVEIAGGDTANGAKTQLYSANGSKAQQFTFTKQSDGSYVIKNVNSGKVLDVADGAAKPSAVVQQFDANGSTAQRWFLRDSGSGWYLQSALGNWVLDIAGGNTSDGATVALYEPNGSTAQKFFLASVDAQVPTNTKVRIQSAKNANMVMDMTDGSTANGARVQVYAWNGSDAQSFRLHEVGNGVYRIMNERSGKAIEVAGAMTGDGVAVQQYASNGTAAQHWSVIADGGKLTFFNAATGKAIDVPAGNVSAQVKLQTYTYNASVAQQWTLDKVRSMRERLDEQAAANQSVLADGTYQVSSKAKSSMVMDVSGGSTANGANVQLYADNGTDAQRWTVSHDAKGYVTLTNAASGKVLDVSGGSTANGANIQQYEGNDSWAQKWIAVKNADGSITLHSGAVEGMVADVAGGSTANGANIQLYSANNTNAQNWRFTTAKTMRARLDDAAAKNRNALADGVVTLASKMNSGKVMDVSGGSAANGANVQLYAGNGTNAQKWRVSHDAKGYVTLTNVGSGKVLDVSGGATSNGANIQQYAGNGSWAQKWIAVKNADGSITLHSGAVEGMVADVAGGSTANGANIQLYSANNTNAQKWVLK